MTHCYSFHCLVLTIVDSISKGMAANPNARMIISTTQYAGILDNHMFLNAMNGNVT